MNINLDAAELDILVEALDLLIETTGATAADIALHAKLSGTCR